MRFRAVLLAIFYCIPDLSFAQMSSPGNGWAVTAEAGVGHVAFMDTQIGQNVFSGNGFSPVIRGDYYRPDTETSLQIAASNFNPQTEKGAHRAHLTIWSVHLTELFLFGSEEMKFRPVAGISISAISNRRQITDVINGGTFTDFGSSLGVATGFRYRSEPPGRGWIVSETIRGSVLGLYHYSAYGTQYQTGSVNHPSGALTDLKLGGPGDWLRLDNTLSVGKYIGNGSEAGISYRWDFYRLKQSETSRLATHQIALYYQYHF